MGQEHLRTAEHVLRGARFDVRALAYPTQDGGSQRREVVVPADAVVILPLLDDDTVVLIRNERPAVGRALWELPAGTLEAGEDPDQCAGRELLEETGYRAEQLHRLTSFYSSPGFCTERMFAYRARRLSFEGQHLDDTEQITVRPTALTEAAAMVRDGRIEDGKTIAVLLYHLHFGEGDADGLV